MTTQGLEELRREILKAGTVHFASISFTQKHYSNSTVSPIEHRVQEIVEIGIDDLMKLIGPELTKARLDELNDFLFNWGSLIVANPRRHITDRISTLNNQLKKEGE